MPRPPSAAGGSDERPYLLGPADKIRIDIYALDDLSREVLVNSAGDISIPIAGSVHAAGHSPAQLEQLIAADLRAGGVLEPQVSVNVLDPHSQTVTVDGEVREPGLYPVVGRMTLMRAVAVAKGGTEFADFNKAIVLRSIDGRRYAGVYNLNSIRAGRYRDPEVFSDDTVIIGDSGSARLFRSIVQFAPAVLAPLVYIVR